MAEQPQAVMFETAFVSMAKMLGERLTPALKGRVKAAGVDLDRVQAAYPMEVWERVIQVVVAEVYPGRSVDEGCREFGREFMHGYVQTPLGAAALMMARVVGPKRTLARMDRNFRTATNSSRVTTREVGPSAVEVDISLEPAFVPAWRGKWLSLWAHRAGILQGTLEVIGVTASVELVHQDLHEQRSRYQVSWS